MRSSSTRALESSLFSLINSTSSLLAGFPTQRSRHVRAVEQSLDDNNRGIIIGSTLGGAALVLVCLALVLYLIWQRRYTPPRRTSSRLSKTCASPIMPRPSASNFDSHRVRPITPSPRRLVAINTALPISRPWDVEKATVHTPSGHPATIGWRGRGRSGNIIGDDESPVQISSTRPPNNGDVEQQAQLGSSEVASVSTTFAAEMSSILESISIKSSYSSLRSSGAAVLGVPTRLQTPLSVQKLRAQDSCATSVGDGAAARGGRSVSNGDDGGGGNAGPKLVDDESAFEIVTTTQGRRSRDGGR